MSFSQNNEQDIILQYFRGKHGVLLDVGANDGITLSNSRALMQRGWEGFFVEPSPQAFARLSGLYENDRRAHLYNFALSDIPGEFTLYESGEHLGRGDVALLSSLKHSETVRWKKETFNPVTVEAKDFEGSGLNEFYFDFITIDAEGMDYQILKQIDLSHTGMVCIEWNQNKVLKDQINDYCRGFGLRLTYATHENLIFTR